MGPDEPRYAQVAREMYARGDLVTPTLGGHFWFEKPVLLYWMMMAGYAFFGVSEFAARCGSAVSGLLTIWFTYLIGRKIESGVGNEDARGFAALAAAALASSLGLIAFSRAASFDIVLTMTITASLACFLHADLTYDARRKRLSLAGFYAFIGAALLAKGLVGVVIPCVVVLLYFALQRRAVWRLRAWRNLGIWWGPLLAAGVAALWYAPIIARHGWDFINQFFVQHHFARFATNKYHHPQPIYFYLLILLLLPLPWTPVFLVAVAGIIKRWKEREDDRLSRLRVFAVAWIIVPLAFFSLSNSKLPGYILPVLPAAALITGDGLTRFVNGELWERRAVRASGILMAMLAALGCFYLLKKQTADFSCILASVLCFVVGGLVSFYLAGAKQRRQRLFSVGVLALAMCGGAALILTCTFAQLTRRESVRDLIRAADARGYAGAQVFSLHMIERTAEFYAAGRLLYDEQGEPKKFEGPTEIYHAARERVGDNPVLVLVPLEYSEQLTSSPLFTTETIGDNGAIALIAVRAK